MTTSSRCAACCPPGPCGPACGSTCPPARPPPPNGRSYSVRPPPLWRKLGAHCSAAPLPVMFAEHAWQRAGEGTGELQKLPATCRPGGDSSHRFPGQPRRDSGPQVRAPMQEQHPWPCTRCVDAGLRSSQCPGASAALVIAHPCLQPVYEPGVAGHQQPLPPPSSFARP